MQRAQRASFFSGVSIRLGTILGRFSIIYFRGLGLRIRVRVWVRVNVRVWVGVRVRVASTCFGTSTTLFERWRHIASTLIEMSIRYAKTVAVLRGVVPLGLNSVTNTED